MIGTALQHPSFLLADVDPADWRAALRLYREAVAIELAAARQLESSTATWEQAAAAADRVAAIIAGEIDAARGRAARRIRAEGLNDDSPFADALETGDWTLIAI